jgi:hypothetical protein
MRDGLVRNPIEQDFMEEVQFLTGTWTDPTGQASGDKEGEYSTSVGERVVTAGEVATGVVLGEEGGSRIG